MEPLLFKPLLKQIRWGGRKLGTELNKPIGDASNYAESWEIADQPSGTSVVACGKYAGQTLSELMSNHSDELLGRHAGTTQFPLLIKFLDANDWLSLQVHPNDQQALDYEQNGNGKTEAWIILHAEPDSKICSGLKSGVTRDDFEKHLTAGTVEETLHVIPARVGDCVFVPSQTVHALGPGILLAEIQQQSNLTFRLHDWGRLGTDGKPRQIHVQESLACIDFDRGPVNPVSPTPVTYDGHSFEELVRCDYFVIRRHSGSVPFALQPDDGFRVVMILEGTAELTTEESPIPLSKGMTVLIPASTSNAVIAPQEQTTLLEVVHP